MRFNHHQFISLSIFFFICSAISWADTKEVISLFPLGNYNQNINHWIKSTSPNYDKPLLKQTSQIKHMDLFYEHYFGKFSPWDNQHIKRILQQRKPSDIKSLQQNLINQFDNRHQSNKLLGYGENYRPYGNAWIVNIKSNINISQFNKLSYKYTNRAITIDNLSVRSLPTDDMHFYNYKSAGQGFPFDNLQMSSIWAGTPVYIIGETRDHVWNLVITPDVIGWVKGKGLARANQQFIKSWLHAANNNMAAITHTQTTIVDTKNQFLFTAYVGAVFPAIKHQSKIKLLVPAANVNQAAMIKYAMVTMNQAVIIPLPATPHHFSEIMNSLIGRPYGWGGMLFYNDCSAELKSLFTPFGIWLPRNSSEQLLAGKVIDLSSNNQSKRINYLIKHGKKFLTLIYIDNHIFLYIGNYPNPHNKHTMMAMTYQNIWGLKPHPAVRRAIIGKSVLLPLLSSYPEDHHLASLASRKHFKMIYLS